MVQAKPPRRHLRRTLALEFLLIAGAIHLVLIVAIVAVQERQMRRQFDAELLRRAERIAGAAAQDLVPAAAVAQAAGAELLTGSMTPIHAQARALDGSVESSTLAAGRTPLPLPFDPEAEVPHRGPFYQTIDGAAIGRPRESFRVITMLEEGPPPYYLQAAASNQAIATAIADLRQLLLLLALPGAMLGAGTAAWLISGHVVRRIEEISRAVQRLSPASYAPRIDVPAGSDEIGGMVVEMNSMLSRLEGAFHAQERFIVDVTHELKTPVSVMLAEAQVLKKSNTAGVERYRQFVESVEEEMRRLGSLLESFLTLARSGHGPRYISESLVDLTETALEAMERCGSAARERQVQLNFVLRDDDPAEGVAVRGDQELLTTLVANLIRNALDDSDAGAIVDVEIATDGKEAKVTVSHKAAASSTTSRRGRELAFAVAQGIAELHGGEILTMHQDDRQRAALRLPVVQAA
jgi:signal transduction histidine kinase